MGFFMGSSTRQSNGSSTAVHIAFVVDSEKNGMDDAMRISRLQTMTARV